MQLKLSDPQKRESAREYVYRVLSDNILDLHLIPGTAMSEKEVAVFLNTSRTPVREAFIRLAQEELLDILPQRGTYVAKIDLAQVAESRFMRETMESAVMKIACAKFPPERLSELRECLALQAQCIERQEYRTFFELDGTLHGIIFAGCDKARTWRTILQMNLSYSRVRAMNLLKGRCEMPRLFEQHQQIVDAIAEKNVERGQTLVNKHINKVILDVEELKKEYVGYFK